MLSLIKFLAIETSIEDIAIEFTQGQPREIDLVGQGLVDSRDSSPNDINSTAEKTFSLSSETPCSTLRERLLASYALKH